MFLGKTFEKRFIDFNDSGFFETIAGKLSYPADGTDAGL